MTAWEHYLAENVDPITRTHRDHPNWKVSGVWEFTRSDGLLTAHKMESPFVSWQETVDVSMQLAAANIPLGTALPAGMRDRDDPDYGPLWPLQDRAAASRHAGPAAATLPPSP